MFNRPKKTVKLKISRSRATSFYMSPIQGNVPEGWNITQFFDEWLSALWRWIAPQMKYINFYLNMQVSLSHGAISWLQLRKHLTRLPFFVSKAILGNNFLIRSVILFFNHLDLEIHTIQTSDKRWISDLKWNTNKQANNI